MSQANQGKRRERENRVIEVTVMDATASDAGM